MALSKKAERATNGDAPELRDDQHYSVTLLRQIVVGRTRVRPGAGVIFSGAMLKVLTDGDYTDVQPVSG